MWLYIKKGEYDINHIKIKYMNKIAVIGAGTMGRGISQILLEFGKVVYLNDINEIILKEAKNEIEKNLFLKRMMVKDYDTSCIDKLNLTSDLSEIADAELIIENVTESFDIKESVYKKLNKIASDNAIFFVNTSCISITKIAALMNHPENVIGVHFMNPVSMINSVEVIKGFYTSKETIDKSINFLKNINKSGILVDDNPGFVSNRISHLMINEAAFIVQEQVAEPKTVDEIFRKCYSHKMGPLETADLIGLDTVVNSLDVLFDEFRDQKFRCCPLLKKMVEAGICGRKTGKGFYNYR